MHITRGLALALGAATLVAGAFATNAVASPQTGRAAVHGPTLDHVFVIMLENHARESVIDRPNMPFTTQLANTYAQASKYYGVTHPSEPNYIAATSGSNWWVNNDDPANRFDHRNIVDELEAHHISWAAYMEAMPQTGWLGDNWPSDHNALYASKHNPFVLYNDVRDNAQRLSHIKPYTDLAADLDSGNAPRYVWISPDQCNDLHGGVYTPVAGYPETQHCGYSNAYDPTDPNEIALEQNADAFMRKTVTTIMQSKAWTPHSAIFIVADEGDYNGNYPQNGNWSDASGCCDSPVLPAGAPDVSPDWPGGVYGGGIIPAIVVSPKGPRHYVDTTTEYNHYSMLLTIEQAFGLGELGFTSDSAQVKPMWGLINRH
ncbi:MAG TPA: alkaline phosphatase family protein [Marmoricola sp.]|nr:alkaline phosphatase family protein [Marmoricola sp.]